MSISYPLMIMKMMLKKVRRKNVTITPQTDIVEFPKH